MSIAYETHPAVAASPATENHVVQTTHTTLKYLFGLVPIVAGADKFTHFLTAWDAYLNPLVSSLTSLSAATIMHAVGAIEIAAGILVFLRPRIGGFVVMGWLLAIALQLILWGHFLDVAVRDIVIALAGALTLARLTPLAERAKISAR
jgi:hypothetical protein